MSEALATRVEITRNAARLGFAEYRSQYTLRSWFFGWGLRLIFQVVFFATIGTVVGDSHTVRYLAVGNILAVGTIESTSSVLSLVRDRRNGTLELLVSAPGDAITALLSRSLNNPVSGFASSMVVLLFIVPIFGIHLPGAAAVAIAPIVLLSCFSAYCYGAFIGAITMRFPNAGWGALNVAYLILMAFTGVNVPLSYWPAPVAAVADLLPVTHGLSALRGLLDGAPAGRVCAQLAAEATVAAGWLAAAALLLSVLIRHGRKTGGLDGVR
ncbi:ABC transporter permease [Kitasatospora sp. NPDC008050]|uniref:ABC transporter permease n=1 Tax=Kitasatospora sp. NPDC008050 TaxID=3364021 RepID=UPI0036E9A73B